ncbi:hypothetical protein SCHPADRAFT_456201 [Schizopora paradoxa]|uniref:Uncharacterized protein n=1 Tax=Schizopora paradoxa TaxID=27342 RepID=A0A0H2S445_9AGAM|nr:hypothetical protein SCHPADRAFT_456201 [Schizopora paradoxa]
MAAITRRMQNGREYVNSGSNTRINVEIVGGVKVGSLNPNVERESEISMQGKLADEKARGEIHGGISVTLPMSEEFQTSLPDVPTSESTSVMHALTTNRPVVSLGLGASPVDPLSARSTNTDDEEEHNLDTDVNLMEVDVHRRRRARTIAAASDRSNSQIDGRFTSDFGSVDNVYGMPDDEVHMVEDDHDFVTRTWVETGGRRGPPPMNIPNSMQRSARQTGHSSSFADIAPFNFDDGVPPKDYKMQASSHAQARRPSRSLDDDLRSSALHLQHKGFFKSIHGGSRDAPLSELDIWSAALVDAKAGAQVQAQQEGSGSDLDVTSTSEPYAEFVGNYILGATMNSSGSRTYDGEGGLNGMRMNIGSIANREREGSWSAGWGIGTNVGRRPSTATVDDLFLRFVKKNDFSYDERRREWCFAREKSELDHATPSAGDRYGQEIWRCVWVGRYMIERVRSKSAEADPTKPPQIRLNVKHIPDPHSKGNTRGGPLTFIHKHSRAQAFSIFRGHALPQRHLKTSSSILLAPKKVQDKFTSTRTTRKLITHGLIDDQRGRRKVSSGGNPSNASSSTVATTSSATPSSLFSRLQTESMSSIASSDSEESSAERSDKKGKAVVHGERMDGSDAITSSNRVSQRTDSPSRSPRKVDEPRSPPDPLRRVRDLPSRPASSLADTQSLNSEGSDFFSSALSDWDQYSINSSKRVSTRYPPPDGLRQQLDRAPTLAKARGSVGSLDDQPVSRTSHAEAFATLDPPFLQHLRNQAAHFDGSGDHDAAPSRFRGLKKLFQSGGPPLKNALKHASLPAGPHVPVLDGKYNPPWLKMAARGKEEEQERLIKNLSNSFRDVRLLPSFEPGKHRSEGKGRKGSENVFDQIPNDSLYMLLPLWPGETDAASTIYDDDNALTEPALSERQYLLVYYVPMLSEDQKETQKRSRDSQTSSANSHSGSSTTKDSKNSIALTAFNIMARLVSYKDVNGSGIRVPTIGLSVTGPMTDAVRAIPSVRFEMDDLALIIGLCDKRERGVEILPEGAEKLGLCLPRTSPDMDLDAPLSPLGRAVVEMAWIGALAVMGFGNP